MSVIEFLKDANVVIGLLISVFCTISGIVYWFHRRMHAVAVDANAQNVLSRKETNKRLTDVEQDINALRHDIGGLSGRMSGVENSMETVARVNDVSLINSTLSEMRGLFSAQIHAMSGQVDTLYQAALRASEKDN